MRILIVWFMFLDTSVHSSSEVRVFEAMARKGNEILCVLPVVKEMHIRPRQNFTMKQIAVRKLLPIVSYLYFCIKALPDLLASCRFDSVILSAEMLPWIVPVIVGRRIIGVRNGLTYAVREPGPPVEISTTHAYYQLFYRMLMLRLCHFCDVVFGVSPMHAAELASKSGVLSVHLWPPSVDERNFDPRRHAQSRGLIRDKLLVSDKFVLIYHGVVSNERGLYELLQAIGLIRKQAPEVVLLILGTGYSAERLRSVAIANGLVGNVIFHGRVPYEEVPPFLAAADAGVIPLPVQPQWSTQTPIKLLEYMAMEKPVILTETESHRWIIGKEGHAFFCGKGTPQELANAILECRARHVAQMRDNVVSRFSSKAIAREVLKLLSHERGR